MSSKSNEHMFIEIKLKDEQAHSIVRWILSWVEMYLLENGLSAHIAPIKEQMRKDTEFYCTKINLCSDIYN